MNKENEETKKLLKEWNKNCHAEIRKEISKPTYIQRVAEGAAVTAYVGTRVPVYSIKAGGLPFVGISYLSDKIIGRARTVKIKKDIEAMNSGWVFGLVLFAWIIFCIYVLSIGTV